MFFVSLAFLASEIVHSQTIPTLLKPPRDLGFVVFYVFPMIMNILMFIGLENWFKKRYQQVTDFRESLLLIILPDKELQKLKHVTPN